jgi:hypothetical protein
MNWENLYVHVPASASSADDSLGTDNPTIYETPHPFHHIQICKYT